MFWLFAIVFMYFLERQYFLYKFIWCTNESWLAIHVYSEWPKTLIKVFA